MLLFRPRDLLFALLSGIIGTSYLSAFDIPVNLPSGQTIHFDTGWLSVSLEPLI